MTTLEIKLASVVVHLFEFCDCGADEADWEAAKSILQDGVVYTALNDMQAGALLPQTRSGKGIPEMLGPLVR